MGVQGKLGSLLWLLLGGALGSVYGNPLEKTVLVGIQNSHFLNGINVQEILNYQTESNAKPYPKSCSAIKSGQSGLYVVEPVAGKQLVVRCELTAAEGGWTVIQKNCRKNPKQWEASWESYKRGFGDPRSDYWLGNEHIHLLTMQQLHRIQFKMRTSFQTVHTAHYDSFSLEGEQSCYRIRLGRYSGNAGDAMTSGEPNAGHDNMRFSTYDRDNDLSGVNCASVGGGGWWYDNCRFANLNSGTGIYWHQLCRGDCYSSEILIQPVYNCPEDGGGDGGDGGGDGGDGGGDGGDGGGGDGGDGGDGGGGDGGDGGGGDGGGGDGGDGGDGGGGDGGDGGGGDGGDGGGGDGGDGGGGDGGDGGGGDGGDGGGGDGGGGGGGNVDPTPNPCEDNK
ncbi:techylectin-5B-like [Spea bombifrons]|uniref:techylectin-5B-like n=1 Tax=Spea bombifrons TaxID=233779 RepID=UPI00234AF481|nr:techylectin-5B-like [Spea bombifrons]